MHLETLLAQELGGAVVRVEDDRRIVVSSTLRACGRLRHDLRHRLLLSIIIGSEPIRQVGGLGYLIDTGGSGYELGQAGLKEACRYLDGRGEYTVLADLITKALGKKPWDSLANIYAGGRSYIASFAHTVFEGMEMGDAVCRRIVEESAYKLSGADIRGREILPRRIPGRDVRRDFPRLPEICPARLRQGFAESAHDPGGRPAGLWRAGGGHVANGRTADAAVQRNFMGSIQRLESRVN